jgi:hypothetical protein
MPVTEHRSNYIATGIKRFENFNGKFVKKQTSSYISNINILNCEKITTFTPNTILDSSVGITILKAGRSRNRGSTPAMGNELLSTPQRPDRLWGPPSLLLPSGYKGAKQPGCELTNHLHQVST